MVKNTQQIIWSLQDPGNISKLAHSTTLNFPLFRRQFPCRFDSRKAVKKKKANLEQWDKKVSCVFMNFSDTFISKKEGRVDN